MVCTRCLYFCFGGHGVCTPVVIEWSVDEYVLVVVRGREHVSRGERERVGRGGHATREHVGRGG